MEKAKKILADYMPEMIKTIQESITFDTVRKLAEGEYPYGKETADCLEHLLQKGKELGFETYNCDYYTGHMDIGKGDEVVGVLGHVDVVPVSADGWIYPPFSGQIADGKIYGRGAIDDKAPLIACMYAAKAVVESGLDTKRRIRIIIGCDEETEMKSIEYYFNKVAPPDMAFTPDGDFPVVSTEKGIYGMAISFGNINPLIKSITAGEAVNVVPDLCVARIDKSVSVDAAKGDDVEITVDEDSGDSIITAYGVSCHGSTPQCGVNAAHKVFKALYKVFPIDGVIDFVANKVCTDNGAIQWGFPISDEVSGSITASFNVVRVVDGVLSCKVDFRFPISYTHDDIERLVLENSVKGTAILGGHKGKSVYVPEDSLLVQTLLKAYNNVMKENAKPKVIGGGTYAKTMKNCVAAGPEFEGDVQVMHQTNEYVSLKRLEQMSEIYLEALYNLVK